jgi:2-dehydro-3-deoxyphosphogluconate aldolase/(4S)-4-hydroxy-2-oxoglutarate aldolase
MTHNENNPQARMAEKIAQIDSICARARIMPVITIAREADILPLADALAAGGLTVLEVTLRSEHGLNAIRLLREQRPELCVGAGTVLDLSMLDAALEAGAQFIVTPGSTRELLRPAWKARCRCCPASAVPPISCSAMVSATAASSCSPRKSAAAPRRSRP